MYIFNIINIDQAWSLIKMDIFEPIYNLEAPAKKRTDGSYLD